MKYDSLLDIEIQARCRDPKVFDKVPCLIKYISELVFENSSYQNILNVLQNEKKENEELRELLAERNDILHSIAKLVESFVEDKEVTNVQRKNIEETIASFLN